MEANDTLRKLRVENARLRKKASDEARTCSHAERYIARLRARVEFISNENGSLNFDNKTFRGKELIEFLFKDVY